MSKTLLISTVAALTLGGALMSAPASAQIGLEIGPGGARITEDRGYRPVIERRVEQRRRVIVEEDDEEECRTEVRRTVNRFGERVTRRVRICE